MKALEHMVIVIYGGMAILGLTFLALGLISIGIGMYGKRKK